MAESSEEVLVRVKSASHPSCEDVEFSCNPKLTTVRQVKEKIRTLYSFHPDIADQRLIYSGHLLDDVQLLTDVFGLSGATGTATYTNQGTYQHSGPYTIHLACTSKSYVSPNQRNVRNDNLSSDSSQSQAYPSQIPNPMMQDPRLVGNMQGQINPFEINGNSGIPPEFYALHQLYVEQMSAYMRSWNLAYGVVGVGGSAIPVPFPGTLPNLQNMPMPNVNVNIPVNNNVPPQQPQPVPQNVPPQQAPLNERVAPAAAARAGGLAGNLGGGFGGFFGAPAAPGADDEENQRDLLDWAYTLSRLVLILSVVYFYSNFTRFLLVVIFTIAIALFQRRPFHQQNAAQNGGVGVDRPGNNNNNPANPNPAAANGAGAANRDGNAEPGNNNGEDGPNNANAGGAAQAATGPDAASQAAEANVAVGAAAGQHRFAYYRDVTWTFLTTFFTSLIPEMPQHN